MKLLNMNSSTVNYKLGVISHYDMLIYISDSNYEMKNVTSHLNLLNIKKRPRYMTLEIQILSWDRHKIVERLK